MPEPVQGPAYYFPSIEKKYGQPISYWLDLIASSGLTKHKALVDWLKADHGLGHGHANHASLKAFGIHCDHGPFGRI